jgi:hypothetical protein
LFSGSSRLLIGSIRTTFLGRRRKFRRLGRLQRRRIPQQLFWRIERRWLSQQLLRRIRFFREQSQFRWFGFAWRIGFARLECARFELGDDLFPLRYA